MFIVVFVFLSTSLAESSENEFGLHKKAYMNSSRDRRVTKTQRFPVIPDFINKISYDVKKTRSEIATLNQIETSFQKLSEKLSEPKRALLKESQSYWSEYYEKETYGLNPANGFVTLTVSGKKKKINAYRENMKAILEGRKLFIENLINDKFDYTDRDEYGKIFKRIDFYQGKVEYFSEERNRPRVAAGEGAWYLFLEADSLFMKSYFADEPEKYEMYKMYALKERLKILELQLTALEILRIEREE